MSTVSVDGSFDRSAFTDAHAAPDQRSPDATTPGSHGHGDDRPDVDRDAESSPGGFFRVVSVLVVLATLAAVAWSLLQGVRVSTRQFGPPAATQEDRSSELRVVGFGDPEGMFVSNLSVADQSAVQVDRFAIASGLRAPVGVPFMLALERPTGALAGLAWVTPEDDTGALTISPQTTAEALIALAPGVLDRDYRVTRDRVQSVLFTDAFDELVAETASVTDIRQGNERLDTALAAVLNEVPVPAPPVDPRCDSALGSRTLTMTGMCVIQIHGTTDIEMVNGQQRWVAVYSSDSVAPCLLVPPRPATLVTTVGERCTPLVDAAAPGVRQFDNQPVVDSQIALASVLTAFSEYALPFADHVLGSNEAGGDASLAAIAAEVDFIDRQFTALLSDNSLAWPAAMTFSDPSVDSSDRTLAMLTLSRLIFADAEIPAELIARSGGYSPNNVGASLLTLYDRTQALRAGGAGPPAWDAASWERVNLSELVN